MKKILITGSKGLIGKKVFNYLKKKNKVYGIDKHNVNLSNENEVKTFFKKNNNFDYFFNLYGANEQDLYFHFFLLLVHLHHED